MYQHVCKVKILFHVFMIIPKLHVANALVSSENVKFRNFNIINSVICVHIQNADGRNI